MEDAGRNDLTRRQFWRNPSLSISNSQRNVPDGPQIGGPYRHLGPPLSTEPGRRPGIPRASHFSPFPPSAARSPPSLAAGGPFHHSRSLSQPAFFSLDSLSPLSHPPCRDSTPTASHSDLVSADVSMEDHDASSRSPPLPPKAGRAARAVAAGDGLPPPKARRHSQSEIPFAFFQSSSSLATSPLLPPASAAAPQLVKLEHDWDWCTNAKGAGDKKLEGDSGDDLFNAYLDLDSLDTLDSSEDKREDLNSRASGTKTNGDSSENEAESSVNEGGGRGVKFPPHHSPLVETTEGTKHSAAGDPGHIGTSNRHCMRLSMDGSIGRLNFGEDSPKLPPSPGFLTAQTGNLKDGASNVFSLEFGNGEFSPAEMKKIAANEKLAEMALMDPKRVKRILANRQSAARSKERKFKYIAELEHKVQILKTEATTLSAQLTLLQNDSAGLTSQNNELKFRLQAMEQQAQLRDALNEALTAEVRRLKLATGELVDGCASNNLNQQLSINRHMFQLRGQQQQQQPAQLPLYQLQLQQKQNSSAGKNHESDNLKAL
ncbi:transcription factor RF2a-like [Phoenix dactylifera]|uniref:Transcription factor RF2a-like n=1 Tax=Phoenix dactylifera TaxID=42345 RepID=A0A8B7BKZ7_PHODC|nr:transcription factor RF2a-like [Phoenix dactylifera]